jgi:HAD superfamily hydrolase (TIGR01484 family)
MRHHALACDYDGTVATDGTIDARAAEALSALRASGRRLVLVTGRLLDDLCAVCPELDLFDAVVAENGAVLFRPATHAERALAGAPTASFVDALRARGVDPLAVGRVIVATSHPHDAVVREVIGALGAPLHVVLNKGAVMVLPAGVDKASGLDAALVELGISPDDTVGVGDAENDLALFARCGMGVAVANALEAVRARAHLVTAGAAGAGVAELCARILASSVGGADRVRQDSFVL